MCRFHKTLYGLKQAPQAWFPCFISFLMDVGFSFSHFDSSLFVFLKDDNLIYLLLYADNIIVTSNNSILLDGFIRLPKTWDS